MPRTQIFILDCTMNVLYNLGIYLLKCGAKAASLRNDKIHKMVEGQSRTFGLLSAKMLPRLANLNKGDH